MDHEAEARRIVRAAKQARPRTPRWLVVLSIVVGVTCCLALATAWYGNRDVKADHRVAAPTSANNGGFATGLLVGIAIGVAATAAVLARKR
ncbi:MAG TPA: hypothetical protein VH143_09740 [Kofleriaceae bacterium]|nr:hypothetical protein [Kofleriaceae bacterium]